ncbi:dihydrofolate reductase [Roseiconus nitratireducens]|uniref:Dihydrofolate reductase n=1 Tax=Roseiconus nitratireducens TaxID=2605748 RepID=A0A5M6D073_9BACT|nr:dihydrofolate reductase [Roseiconus nitratireducens]KAA5540506.1 dihydrofolate reductase [Roseiconus nitratireducens]
METTTHPLIAVVAATPSGVIGRDGDMPWRLRQDLQRFKRMTMGGVLLMGRKTFESIGRPLPGRRTVVITRDAAWSAPGVQTAASPEAAIGQIGGERGFVVGGAQIYAALLPRCDEIWLTRVWSGVNGETRVELDLSEFRVMERERVPAGLRDDVPTEFRRYVRKAGKSFPQKS